MQKIEFEELPSEVQTKLNGLFSESSSLKSVLKPLIKICDEFPGFVFGRLELSVVYMELNDPEEALKNYQSILSDFPDEPAAIAGIATAYAELNELAKAESFANEALEMEYHWPPLYLVLAKVYEQKSKFDDAADSYISAYRLSPNFISGLENYCRLKKLDYQSPEQNVKPPMKRKKLNDLAAFIKGIDIYHTSRTAH